MASANHRPKPYFGRAGGAPDNTRAESSRPTLAGRQQSAPEFFTDDAIGTGLRLYIAEEQQILREAYQSFFLPHPAFDVVGTSGDTSVDALRGAAAALQPNVILLGIKVLHADTVEKLVRVREASPGIAVAMLSASYDVKGIKALREFSRGASVGCAYLLKHTIDTVDQLVQVVQAVSEGR
ncbi:MAG: hypothetical protein V3S98_01600, partial [Dehalococcoidia bacterium]